MGSVEFLGTSSNSFGVEGSAGAGVGVLATADTNGTALKADGRVEFSQSGRVIIASGHRRL